MVKRPTNPFGGYKPPKPLKYLATTPTRRKNLSEASRNRDLAITAVQRGVCLAFNYEDCFRLVEVHTVGITKADRPALNGWQVDGQSNSKTIPDWSTFCFDECFDVRLSDVPSRAPRPDFKKGAKQFRFIDVEV